MKIFATLMSSHMRAFRFVRLDLEHAQGDENSAHRRLLVLNLPRVRDSW